MRNLYQRFLEKFGTHLRVLLILVIFAEIYIFALQPVSIEAGTATPTAKDFIRFRFLPLQLESDLTFPTYSLVGTHEVRFSCWIFNLKTTLTVSDTIPPSAVGKTTHVLRWSSPDPMDCITNLTDGTTVQAEFLIAPDTSKAGEISAIVLLTDSMGNTSSVNTSLIVENIPVSVTVEAGSDEKAVLSAYGLTSFAYRIREADELPELPVGTHTISLLLPHGEAKGIVECIDTTPPTAKSVEVLYYLGEEIKPSAEEFVTDIVDCSSVTATFENIPDWEQLGQQEVSLFLLDESGNIAHINSTLTISRDVPPPSIHGAEDLTVYAGSPVSFSAGVSATDYLNRSLTLQTDIAEVDTNTPGIYHITYSATDTKGNTTLQTVSVNVKEVTDEVLNEDTDALLKELLTPQMTEREKARAIFDWLSNLDNVTYRVCETETHWKRAAHAGFVYRYGNCYTYYAMSRALLERAGFETLEISRVNSEYPHYWNLVYIKEDKGWYHFDTCPHFNKYPLECFLLTNSQVANYSRYYVADYYTFDASLYPTIK